MLKALKYVKGNKGSAKVVASTPHTPTFAYFKFTKYRQANDSCKRRILALKFQPTQTVLPMFLLTMPNFASGEVWISLFTLTLLEIVLGVDNIIFLSIISAKLPEKDQPKARNVGLILAMLLRIVLLFGITWIIGMTAPIFYFNLPGLEAHIGHDFKPFVDSMGQVLPLPTKPFLNGQGLILLLGGLFLLYKATTEIHHKLEGGPENDDPKPKASLSGKAALNQVIIQIALINIVFSFDSILTAVGIANDLVVMIIAVVISVFVMMLFSGPVSKFVNNHPSVQMLGLSFLILIGFSLVAEAAHLGCFLEGSVPKGYLYFAIFFSLFTELLNIRMQKSRKPVQLHGYGKTAKDRGLLDENLLDNVPQQNGAKK